MRIKKYSATGKRYSDEESLLPTGVIVMWSGTLATIPTGWALCDGTGGTPDLRDKFILGWAAGVNPGDTGGASTHTHGFGTIAVADHAAHTHSVTSNVSVDEHGTHTHGVGTLAGSNVAASVKIGTGATSATGAHTTTITGATAANSTGTSATTHTTNNPAVTSGNPSATLTHSVSGSTASGSTLPPYYKLAFIMYLG